jgi:hypothetical protein
MLFLASFVTLLLSVTVKDGDVVLVDDNNNTHVQDTYKRWRGESVQHGWKRREFKKKFSRNV